MTVVRKTYKVRLDRGGCMVAGQDHTAASGAGQDDVLVPYPWDSHLSLLALHIRRCDLLSGLATALAPHPLPLRAPTAADAPSRVRPSRLLREGKGKG